MFVCQGKVDSSDELIVAGDDSNCRMCLINDVKSWAREMEAKGWGLCPRAAAGSCTCSRCDVSQIRACWRIS